MIKRHVILCILLSVGGILSAQNTTSVKAGAEKIEYNPANKERNGNHSGPFRHFHFDRLIIQSSIRRRPSCL